MSRLAEIIVKVTSALGFSESKMRWRLQHLRRWSERSKRKVESKAEQVTYAHKKCRSCRALNDRGDNVCSSCGEPLRWRITQMVERSGVGGLATTSALLIVLLIVPFIAGLVAGQGALELRSARIAVIAQIEFPGTSLWQFLVAPFVHASLLGVIAIGFALFLLGQEIEAIYGRFVMLAWFAVTAFAGALVHHAIFSSPLNFGGQIGLCGLLGVGLTTGHLAGTHRGRELRSLMVKWSVCVFAVLLLVQGNIVGELAAAVVGAVIARAVKPEPTRNSRLVQWALGAVGVVMLASGAALAVLHLGRSSLLLPY